MNEMDGTHYLSELVRKLSNDRNAGSFLGEFTVTATVGGKVKISKEPIECQIMIMHDSVNISTHWEDCGYKGYKDMGLYGRTNSKYFTVTELSNRSFQITDNSNSSNITEFEW